MKHANQQQHQKRSRLPKTRLGLIVLVSMFASGCVPANTILTDYRIPHRVAEPGELYLWVNTPHNGSAGPTYVKQLTRIPVGITVVMVPDDVWYGELGGGHE